MDESRGDRQRETKAILTKIMEDFEQLDLTIELAISDMQTGQGLAEDIEALQRARDAVRRGAALAKGKLDSEQA